MVFFPGLLCFGGVRAARGGTEPLRPFGAPPLAGEAFGVGAAYSFCTGNLGLHTLVLSDKAFRRLYTVSRRNAMERNRRKARLCPPGKAPIQAMAGGAHGVRGPALAAWKIWLAPGRLCPLCPSAKWVVRPQTDEILSGNRFQRGGVPPGLQMRLLYKLFDTPAGEFIFHHSPPGERSPSFCERRLLEVSCREQWKKEYACHWEST